jgi:selenide,water dikinase
MEFMEGKVVWADRIDYVTKALICDAQTSGGLLVALDSGDSASALDALHWAGVDRAVRIGQVLREGEGTIHVR